MGEVGALPVKAGSLGRNSYTIGQRDGVGVTSGAYRLYRGFQPVLHLEYSPGEGRRVLAIEDHWIDPLWCRCCTNQSWPPCWDMVVRWSMRRPLLIMMGVTTPLSSARHHRGAQSLPRCSSKAPSLRNATSRSPGSGMCTLLELGEAQVAPLGQASGRVGVDVAAQWRVWPAVRPQPI